MDKGSDLLYSLMLEFFLRTRTKTWLRRQLRGGKCSVLGEGVLRTEASRLKFLTLTACTAFPSNLIPLQKHWAELEPQNERWGSDIVKYYKSFMFVMLKMWDAQILWEHTDIKNCQESPAQGVCSVNSCPMSWKVSVPMRGPDSRNCFSLRPVSPLNVLSL